MVTEGLTLFPIQHRYGLQSKTPLSKDRGLLTSFVPRTGTLLSLRDISPNRGNSFQGRCRVFPLGVVRLYVLWDATQGVSFAKV